MKILMIAEFNTFSFEGGNSRFNYLLDKIKSKGNDIEFITSRFRHGTKEKRNFNKNEINQLEYKLTLLDEPGYKKNISLKRIYSHRVLAKNLLKYLNRLNYKPDVIYCAVPSLSIAKNGVKFANKNNIKFIIDIQDLWPEAFKMVFRVPFLSDAVFYPMMKQANYIYSHSDEIIAVSETYVNRALKENRKVKSGLSVFLGTDLNFFDTYAKKNTIQFNDNIVRIVYVGTLSISYDIQSIIDSIAKLNEKGINNIKFIVIGDGPLKEKFFNYAIEKKVNCEFTGKLDYPKMVGLLCSCDIAVNPIIEKSTASIINKVGDYAASGLPVINTQNCEEYKKLLMDYNAGISCKSGDIEELSLILEKLINDMQLRLKLGKGNRKLAEEKFDRRTSYDKIIRIIEGR